jgi:hypothetical protein
VARSEPPCGTRTRQLDLLATGDHNAVTEAFERYLHHTDPDALTAGLSSPSVPGGAVDSLA